MPTEFDFVAGTEVAKFIASDNQVDYIQGPLGSGKTVALLLRAMRHAQEQKPSPIDNIRYSRWGIVRNTLPDLKRSTVKTWLELFPEHIYGRFNAAPYQVQRHHCRISFHVAGQDRGCEKAKIHRVHRHSVQRIAVHAQGIVRRGAFSAALSAGTSWRADLVRGIGRRQRARRGLLARHDDRPGRSTAGPDGR